MSKRSFKKDDLLDCLDDDAEGIEKVATKRTGSSRWSSHHRLIFRDTTDGKLFSVHYSKGLTESQDEAPFEYLPDDIECTEVEAYEKTVTDYREVPDAVR